MNKLKQTIAEFLKTVFKSCANACFMKKFYVDTNIWLDFALDRKDNIRPLGEFAFQFFKKCMRNNWLILYSEVTIVELGKNIKPAEIYEKCFRMVAEEKLLLKVSLSKMQSAEAEEISKKHNVPFADALHAIIARDNEAVIVSRDLHFEKLSNIVKSFLPEET